ncbi:hypothetical protein [Arthrospiribacter ruber]|uniref:GyrI-like small molecule binding domain-containing protein n=1 Tax=Arthrospiribacter ruber TaxID=2487934 RepID=A0A951MKD2_9BACT|nr:hypothetical protein [Arthrospiribacter ruber]MBW3470391.1 hypothetical protein [Arthrospiribacter ruber]
MKTKPLIVTGVLLAVVAVLGLYMFGGFNEIEVQKENLGEISLVGIHYKGTPQDPKLKSSFEKIESLAEKNPEAFINTIYLIEPAGKLDTMEVFVGIEKKWAEDLSSFEERNFDASSSIVANIQAHRFVMPGPKKVQKKINSFAKENKLEQPEIFIDQIISPNKVRVIGVKNQ